MDRRQFLIAAGAAGAVLAFPARAADGPPKARPADDPAIWVDAQGGLDGFDEPEPGKYVPGPKLLQAIKSGGSTWSARPSPTSASAPTAPAAGSRAGFWTH